ncbi:MAG: RDD family protein [Kiritimatiellae bacterium]|nr:RDD family protein [Kiritimatiellia bacterium]
MTAVRQTPDIATVVEYESLASSVYRKSLPTLLNVQLVYGFFMLALQIGLVLLHPKRRALHDLIAGTVVVCMWKPQSTPAGESTAEACSEWLRHPRRLREGEGWTQEGGEHHRKDPAAAIQ